MVSTAPDAIDIVDFQFKEHLRLKAFQNAVFSDTCNLVTVASRYGLIFIAGESNELQVLQVKDIENLSKEVTEFKQRIIPLPSRTLHISVNCDSTKLAVVITKDNCPHVMFYDVLSFLKQNYQIVNHTRLSPNPQCKILQIDWNPALPDIFTAVKDDGTLLVYDFKGAPIELPPGANATCFCWSPKGKQLAVGSRDGKITQYKIDLKAVKVTEAPPGFGCIISLCWVSSFQFFGVYQAGDQISLICVDAPKAGACVYTNYEDVCYSNGIARPEQFYLIHQLHWNVLFVASSNSMEIAILGMDANSKWTQWNLNDNSRATLPLGGKHEDTLPIGCTFNVGTTHFKIGDDVKQGPTLLVLSDHGTLVMFNAINARPGAVDICSGLENVPDRSGEAQFTMKQVAPQQQVQPSQPQQVQQQPQQQSIQIPKPVASMGQFAAPGQTGSSGQLPQMPKVPGLTINPVSVAAQSPAINLALSGQSQIQGQGLFGSSGVFKPAAQPPKTTPTPPSAYGFPLGGQPSQTPFSSSAFGQKPSFAPPVATVVSQPQQKPQMTPTPLAAMPVVQTPPNAAMPLTPPAVETSSIIQATPEKQIAAQSSTASVKTTEKLPVTDETEAMIANLVREECLTLEGELHDLLKRGTVVAASMKIGTDAEMSEMAKKELDLEEFYTAIKENINTHDSEVYTLKQALLQTWACYEEARTRLASSKDPVTKVLLQSMPLDPASQHQLDEINRMMYYIDSQLVQANQSLDEQWDTFQDTMMKSNKLKLPTMESVYQSMVQHTKTMQKQKYMLKHISARIKATNRARDKTLLNVTVGTNLEGVENLEEELGKLQIQQVAVPQLYTRLIERQSKLNVSKIKKLQDVLGNRDTSRVCVSKPQLNNSTVQLTTLLAAPLSPIGKKPLGGFDRFADKLINSTPKPKTLTELMMPKVPVQTYSPTTQGFGAGSPAGLFGKSSLPTTSMARTPGGLFGKSAAPPMFSSATVVPVPGPGNTSSAPNTAFTSVPAKPGFAFGVTSSTGMFKPAAPATTGVTKATPPITTTSSSSFMFAGAPGPNFGFSSIGSSKPALLATPTTPPVGVSMLFGTIGTATGTGGTSTGGSYITGGKTGTTTSTAIGGVTAFSAVSASPSPSVSSTTSKASASISSIFSNSSLASSATASTVIGASTTSTTGNMFGSSSSSAFGVSVATPSGNIFGGSVSVSTTAGIFGSSGKSIFEVASTPNATVPTCAGITRLFGASTPPITATACVSVSATKAPPPPPYSSAASTPASKSLFGAPPSTSSGGSEPEVITTTAATVFGSIAPGTSIFAAAAAGAKSAFGGLASTPTPAATSAFGGLASTPTPAATSAFGGLASTPTPAATSAFGGLASTPTPAATSAFGGLASTPTPAATSAFGGLASTPTPAITSMSSTPAFGSAGSAFGSAPLTPPVTTVSTSVPASGFGATTTTSAPAAGPPPPFGATFGSVPTTPPVTTAPPAFGAVLTPAPTPAFGATTTTTPTSAFGSPFGSTPLTTPVTTAAPAFGAVPTSATTAAPAPALESPFGSAPTTPPIPTTTAPPAFGTGSVFGGSAFGTTSIFGGSGGTTPTTTSATPPAFGAAASAASPFASSPFAPTTTTTPFGGNTSTSGFSSSGSLFAQPAKFVSGGSIFGGGTPAAATTTTATASAGAFGSSPSVFGNASSTTSPFGGTTAFGTASNSPFAQSDTTTPQAGAGAFGASSTFGSGSTFGGSASPPPQSPFAPSSPTNASNTNAFSSFGGLSVGGTNTFGQSPAAASPGGNPFGAKTDQKSPFGTTTTNLFATPASTTAGSIFGSQPATSTFGGAGFGNTSFGQPGSFGNSSFGPTPAASGGAFSSGNQSVQQAGFGSAAGFQKQAFGSAPVFGQPAFGGNASFGAAPTFGGGATFGSPGKVFGGGGANPQEVTAAPFGTPGAQSSTFGSIAQQNTVGFGNLAQQAAPPQQAALPFSGGSSFTNWRN